MTRWRVVSCQIAQRSPGSKQGTAVAPPRRRLLTYSLSERASERARAREPPRKTATAHERRERERKRNCTSTKPPPEDFQPGSFSCHKLPMLLNDLYHSGDNLNIAAISQIYSCQTELSDRGVKFGVSGSSDKWTRKVE